MKIYCVTYENDGDFPEKEIALITTSKHEAKEAKRKKPEEYALSHIAVWENQKDKSYQRQDGQMELLLEDWHRIRG